MVWLWVALVVALLATLTLCGVMLARKFVALVQAFADFIGLPAILDGVHRADPEARRTPAVLRPRGEVGAEHAARRQRRRERRDARRSERITRGRLLLSADLAPVTAQFAGLESNRRRVGARTIKDDAHVE